jgi:hypothetical protein
MAAELLRTAAVSADSTRLLLDAQMDIALAECPQHSPFYSLARHTLRQLLATESRWLLGDRAPSQPIASSPHGSKATISLRSGLLASFQSHAPPTSTNSKGPDGVSTRAQFVLLSQNTATLARCDPSQLHPTGVGSHPLTDMSSDDGSVRQPANCGVNVPCAIRAVPQRCARRTASGKSRYGPKFRACNLRIQCNTYSQCVAVFSVCRLWDQSFMASDVNLYLFLSLHALAGP